VPKQSPLLAFSVAVCLPGFGTTPQISTDPSTGNENEAGRCVQASLGQWAPGGRLGNLNSMIQECPTGYTTYKMGATSIDSCYDQRVGGKPGHEQGTHQIWWVSPYSICTEYQRNFMPPMSSFLGSSFEAGCMSSRKSFKVHPLV
jgi:hypothetical protein